MNAVSGHPYLSFGLALLVLAAAAVPLNAAPKNKPRPSSGRAVTLADAGVKLRMVPNAELQMLPPPGKDAVRKSDGAAAYRAQKLWLHGQKLAVWSGKDVTAVLAEVKFPPLAKPDEFFLADAPPKWEPYVQVPDEGELRRWAESFTGEKIGEITKLTGGGDFAWRRLQTGKPELHLFFGHTKNNGPLRMLLLLFRWQESAASRSKECTRLAESCALSVRLIPRTAGAGEKAAPSADSKPSDEYARRLAQAKKSIAGMRDWYIQETPNYIFVSNQRSRNDIKRYQSSLEAAREVFRRYFPPEKETSCVGVVKLFSHREEFLRYPGADEWSGGFWNSGTLELVVSPLDPRVDSKINEKQMQKTTLHEGFHQYIYYASNEIGPDLWFNEGCAQFFEFTDPRRGDVGDLDKTTEARLIAAVERADNDLARFISLNIKQFYEEGKREQNYALAHALMYYLLRGAPANGDNTFTALPRRYVEALQKTRDLKKARDMALEGIDTRQLASKLKDFWSDKKKLRKARLKK